MLIVSVLAKGGCFCSSFSAHCMRPMLLGELHAHNIIFAYQKTKNAVFKWFFILRISNVGNQPHLTRFFWAVFTFFTFGKQTKISLPCQDSLDELVLLHHTMPHRNVILKQFKTNIQSPTHFSSTPNRKK